MGSTAAKISCALSSTRLTNSADTGPLRLDEMLTPSLFRANDLAITRRRPNASSWPAFGCLHRAAKDAGHFRPPYMKLEANTMTFWHNPMASVCEPVTSEQVGHPGTREMV